MAVVRMKDIARELNVSVVTVSKALRNHEDISEETRGKVLRLMREMNYRPNLAARALVTGRSFIVGFVLPGLLHSFFAEVAKGLTNVFRKKGYGLVIATSEEDPELERQEIEQLLARRVDALIVATTQRDDASFRRIEEQGIPYVLIDRRIGGLEANFVGVDDQLIGTMATEHLIQCGCRRIACIYAGGMSQSIGRLEGYRRALEKHGLSPRPEYVRTLDDIGDASDDAAYATMKEFLALAEPPDGVFCFNDPSALNAMKAVLDAGLRIPDDVAIVGSGNIRHADFLRVPLTTIDQNSVAIGERAGKLALALIESKDPQLPKTILLEPRLVMRSSSMRIPH
jgi:LacI family transcriptional regulator